MSRETLVLRNGKWMRKEDAPPLNTPTFNVLPDISEFRTQEGTVISSRSHLRAYEERTGSKQVGNDFATLHRELRQKVYGRD